MPTKLNETSDLPTTTVRKVVRRKKVVTTATESEAPPAEAPIVPTVTSIPVVVETIPVTETVEAPPVVEVEEVVEPKEDEPVVKKRVRRTVSKETFFQDFEAFFKEAEVNFADQKNFVKRLKQLRLDAYRLLKIKTEERKSKEGVASGFMKPVYITKDLADFIGVPSDQPIPRLTVTREICRHIKEKDLQNPSDRREILPDEALRKLFHIDPTTNTEPLTYYSLQKKIQPHILKINTTK